MKQPKRNAEWRRHMLSLQGKSGAMQDRRTKRNRSRSENKRKAIGESRRDDA